MKYVPMVNVGRYITVTGREGVRIHEHGFVGVVAVIERGDVTITLTDQKGKEQRGYVTRVGDWDYFMMYNRIKESPEFGMGNRIGYSVLRSYLVYEGWGDTTVVILERCDKMCEVIGW